MAAAGGDGIVRLIDPEKGTIVKEVAPVPVRTSSVVASTTAISVQPKLEDAVETEVLPPRRNSSAAGPAPGDSLDNRFAYAQVRHGHARLGRADRRDADGRHEALGATSPRFPGRARSGPSPTARRRSRWPCPAAPASVAVAVSGVSHAGTFNFVHDVAPVLSRLGCNAGTCHGSAKGKNGFKLSLRGYDPLFDVRALTDDLAARRVNLASPDDSLMLLKPTAAVPHVGGQVIAPGEPYYEILRRWIADGAKLDLTRRAVTKIELFPQNPVIAADRRRSSRSASWRPTPTARSAT